MKKYEMKKMTDFESAKYQGFTLQSRQKFKTVHAVGFIGKLL